jgi:hypothetical protein
MNYKMKDMNCLKKKQTKPKWFEGVWYETGEQVTNPFSGECYTLTGPELSMYDFIMGSQMVFEMKPKSVTAVSSLGS